MSDVCGQVGSRLEKRKGVRFSSGEGGEKTWNIERLGLIHRIPVEKAARSQKKGFARRKGREDRTVS